MSGWPGIIAIALVSAAVTLVLRHRAARHPRWRRFIGAPAVPWALWTLLAIVLAAIAAPVVAPSDPTEMIHPVLRHQLLAPSWDFPFGTDNAARDVLSRVLYGARASLLIAGLGAAVSVTVAVLVGALAGFAGRMWDAVLMRTVDAALAIPAIFLLLVVIAFWGQPQPAGLAVLLGLTGWFGGSRLVRAEVLSIRESDFVTAAYAVGASSARVVLRHVLPHIAATAAVTGAIGLGSILLVESALSYLGLSINPPAPSWGHMINDARTYMREAPWLVLAPGLTILLTVTSAHLLGDGLRAALNPREST